MKNQRKTNMFWALGLAALLLAGCNASSDSAQTSTTKAAPTAVSTIAETNSTARKAMPEIVMYKSEGCECCTGWAEHMRKAGFSVIESKQEDMSAIKSQHGVSENLASCHTATVNGYVIEGHVPASDVARLLKERPKIAGLTAPGMPMKSPGMQKPGLSPKGYDVLAFNKEGKSRIFTRYYADGKLREFMR